EHRAARVVPAQTDPAAPRANLHRHPRRQADRALEWRFLSLPVVNAAIEVQYDPEVGRERLLEGLAHELLVLLRERPVDASIGIPGRVFPDAPRLGRVVGPVAESLRGADVLAGGHDQLRQ